MSQPKLVKEIMTRHVETISPFASVRDALEKMKTRQVKSLVVEKQNDHDAYGIMTYTNLLQTIIAEDGDIDLLNVYDLQTKPALFVPAELDVRYVARMMVNQGVRRVLVLSENQLVGIVAMDDIIEVILELVQ